MTTMSHAPMGSLRCLLASCGVACRLWSVLAGPRVGSLLVMCGNSKRLFFLINLNAPRPVCGALCFFWSFAGPPALRPAPSCLSHGTNPNPKVRKSGAVGKAVLAAQDPGFDGAKSSFF